MATLDDIIREQNTIHEELERIASDPDTTEDKDGNMRDTLVSRWKELDEDRAKIVSRMEELELIRKAAADPANREPGDGGGGPGRLADEFAEESTRKATSDPKIARHILMFGNDEYYEAFRDYLNDPLGEGVQRAAGALSLVLAQGGYMVPFTLDQMVA